MIYLVLRGRIGNQLFMYAYANSLRTTKDELIIIDDSKVLKENWENSLVNYNLPNVKYVHKPQYFSSFFKLLLLDFYHQKKIFHMDFNEKYEYEIKKSEKYLKRGYLACENGYYNFNRCTKDLMIDGYFQSERYFIDKKNELLDQLDLNKNTNLDNYPGIDEIREKNSVCISIKIEHNIGSSLYDVCTKEYWTKAIDYIINNVENPLFFICSDNVEYVKNNLIDCTKYRVICQDPKSPVYLSLAVMSLCKHFIIGNTSYGWWAQYMSCNKSKIVIAPSKWMKIDMPIDIYQDNWIKIDV